MHARISYAARLYCWRDCKAFQTAKKQAECCSPVSKGQSKADLTTMSWVPISSLCREVIGPFPTTATLLRLRFQNAAHAGSAVAWWGALDFQLLSAAATMASLAYVTGRCCSGISLAAPSVFLLWCCKIFRRSLLLAAICCQTVGPADSCAVPPAVQMPRLLCLAENAPRDPCWTRKK